MTIKRNPITRRRFITIGGGAGIWIASGCQAAPGQAFPATTAALGTSSTNQPGAAPVGDAAERVLVLVQLLGGNDALNTVVPIDGRYRDARPDLALPESDLLALSGMDEYSLHPALSPLLPYWDDGSMAIGAGVAFAEQTRSHFESRDVWWRATDDPGAAGWLSRWMEAAAIDSPEEPLEAIALGVGPRALAGSSASAVNDPLDFELTPPSPMSDDDFEKFLLSAATGEAGESALMSAARGSLPATLSVQKILNDLTDDNAGDPYLERNTPALTIQMQTAAALITSRPGLRIVTVGIEGFDTHADQLDRQASLLGDTADAIARFWETLTTEDRARTLVMTTSEFGRRVAENGSLGTDHGNSGIQFLIGGATGLGKAGVNGGQIIGGYGLDQLVDGDLPTSVPGVDLYADALRWLGGPVPEVLGVDPPSTGLITV